MATEEKVSTTQHTVKQWQNNADNKQKATTTQPWSVKVKDNKDDEAPATIQPWSVGAWMYNANDKEIKASAAHQLRTINADKVKDNDDDEAPATIQPWSVGAWMYNANDKEIKASAAHQLRTINADKVKGNDEDEAPATIQPWSVGAWMYNANDKEIKASAAHQSRTINADKVKGNDDDEAPATIQPWSVGAWMYNENGATHHNHAIRSSDGKNEEDNLSSTHKMKGGNMIAGSVFFVEKDLHLGAKLRHDFQMRPVVPFLSSDMAKAIPFSVDKLPEILNRLSISPNSAAAPIIKETLSICLERARVKIENRTCAQSLEALVNFVVQELGTDDIKATMMNNLDNVTSGVQEYKITKLRKMPTPDNTMVTSHRMVYPYVVYYCHHQHDIALFSVTLEDPKGVSIDTSAICHYDTYAWKPDGPALRYLNLRPGDSPICHFSGATDIAWTLNSDPRKQTMAAAA